MMVLTVASSTFYYVFQRILLFKKMGKKKETHKYIPIRRRESICFQSINIRVVELRECTHFNSI